MTNEMYPKYLSTSPSGIDLYEGKSQDNLASAIKEHIVSIDKGTKDDEQPVIPRIIGIEGAWGCGKSNVIKKIEDLMSNDYVFFTYDAWGNQEDLQRRSVLEQLTKYLIDRKELSNKTSIKVLREKEKNQFCLENIECTWQERLETLCASKSQTRNFVSPVINEDSKILVLLLLISGILPAITKAFNLAFPNCEYLKFLFVVLFLGMWGWFFFIRLRKDGTKFWKLWPDKNKLVKMWRFYQSNSNTETTSYTTSQNEPTVREFRDWMQDINDSLFRKRLVVVFDNMDRLPAEKVRALWSSIHTFFAESGYSKVWCIVPFDKKHLADACFTNTHTRDEAKYQCQYPKETNILCSAFVSKTFPVVFRVPDAVITDYRGVFKQFLINAFGSLIKDEDIDFINRVFRVKYPTPNARRMIGFVNGLVTQYGLWKNRVSVVNMALYILNKNIIDYHSLINGNYINGFEKYYRDNEETKTQIAAMHYGVELSLASQLPLRQYLQSILGAESINEDINEVVSKNRNFFTILDEEIHDMDCKDKLLTSVDKLSKIDSDNSLLYTDWNYLAEEYIKDDSYPIDAKSEFRELVLHSSDDNAQSLLGEYLRRVKDHSGNIKGSLVYSYYVFIQNIAESEEKRVPYSIPDTVLSAEHYIEYVKDAKSEYNLFPVSCDKVELVDYVKSQINASVDISSAIEYLNSDSRYPLENIYCFVINKIESEETGVDCYDLLFNYCRITRGNFLIEVDNESNRHLIDIWRTMSSQQSKYESYAEISLLLALNGEEVARLENGTLKIIGERIWSYTTVSELFDKLYKYSTNSIRTIVAYCISNHNVQAGFTDNVVCNLERIHSLTNSSYNEILYYVDACQYHALGASDKSIEFSHSALSISLVDVMIEENNTFCKLILSQLKEQVERQTKETLCYSNHTINPNNYWTVVLDRILQLGYYNRTNVPELLIQICDEILYSISEGNLTIVEEDSIEGRILNLVPFDRVSSKVYEILGVYTSGRRTMNVQKFKLLHTWFESMSEISPGAFLNAVVNPVMKDADCQKIIAINSSFYYPLMNNHLSEDSDLLAYLKDIKKNGDGVEIEFKEFVDTLSNVIIDETHSS